MKWEEHTVHKHLNEKHRFYIEKRLAETASKSQIARELGVHHSTIGREIKRNTDPSFHGLYSHLLANKLSRSRRSITNHSREFLTLTQDIINHIKSRLSVHSSPEVISGELKLEGK